jgi:acetyltransferase
LFNPRSIAIVGASDDLNRIGGLPIKFLRRHKYPGKIFPVNPKYREIAGLPATHP